MYRNEKRRRGFRTSLLLASFCIVSCSSHPFLISFMHSCTTHIRNFLFRHNEVGLVSEHVPQLGKVSAHDVPSDGARNNRDAFKCMKGEEERMEEKEF